MSHNNDYTEPMPYGNCYCKGERLFYEVTFCNDGLGESFVQQKFSAVWYIILHTM